MRFDALGIAASVLLASIALVTSGTSIASGQVTRRASVGPGGSWGNGESAYASISADGRCVAYFSHASNLVPGDTNGRGDIFVYDRQTGATERVSVGPGGMQADDTSILCSISSDGRFVAFGSYATNLVPGDTNFAKDIFVRDRTSGATERVSVDSSEAGANDASESPSISSDGRYVAFWSYASNLVTGDTNSTADIFVRDRQNGTTARVSVGPGGLQSDAGSQMPSISGDGRWVAFQSTASNLVAGDTNGTSDVFVHDRVTGATERVSVGLSGTQGNATSWWPSIAGDGRRVAFDSFASNLAPDDTNSSWDIFVHDRQTGMTERVSVATDGTQGDGSSYFAFLSPDGGTVAFESTAANLVPGDTNGVQDAFARVIDASTTVRASVASNGAQADANSSAVGVSQGGRFVTFTGYATNLVPGDTNGSGDVFIRDLRASGFTEICEPGIAGVIACPCSNPPSSPGRGCDNSAATGGASLSADGLAYLSMDSLVFTTSGERPTALSILLQGSTSIAGGIAYGQGVRCVGNDLKRLYKKPASGGSITVPDFGLGEPTVSARSAALGSTILAGQSRWYLVYYRDPVVLGGCAASSTFNATQAGRVDWSL